MRLAGSFMWGNKLTMILNNSNAAEQELGINGTAAQCCTQKAVCVFWKSLSTADSIIHGDTVIYRRTVPKC